MRFAAFILGVWGLWGQAAPVVRFDAAHSGAPNYCRSTTGNATYTCALPTYALTSYSTGGCLVLNADFANVTTATVNVDSVGAKSILKHDGSALAAGDIPANKPKLICYDGTQFLIQGDGGSGGGLGDPGGNGLVQRTSLNTTSAVANSSTVGQTLRVTGSSTYGWGALDLGDADAITGLLPTANLATRSFVAPMLNGSTMPDTSGLVFQKPVTVDSTVDFYGYNVWSFDGGSTDTVLHGAFTVPQDFVSGAQVCPVWTSTATSGNVRWKFGYYSIGTDDATSFDQSADEETPLELNDVAPTAAWRRLSACHTLNDSNIAAGDTMIFRQIREASDTVNDTMSGAALLVGLEFRYSGK